MLARTKDKLRNIATLIQSLNDTSHTNTLIHITKAQHNISREKERQGERQTERERERERETKTRKETCIFVRVVCACVHKWTSGIESK